MTCIDIFFKGQTNLKYDLRKIFFFNINETGGICTVMRPDQCMNMVLEELCNNRNINIEKCFILCDEYDIKDINQFKRNIAYQYDNGTKFIIYILP